MTKINYQISTIKTICVGMILAWHMGCSRSNFGQDVNLKKEKDKPPVQNNDVKIEPPPPREEIIKQVLEPEDLFKTGSQVIQKIEDDTIEQNDQTIIFKGGSDSKGLSPNQKQHLWLATRSYDATTGGRKPTGLARKITLVNDGIESDKTWTVGSIGFGGTRTYVLEGGGVVLAKQGGVLYFIHDGIPEGPISEDPKDGLYYKIPGVNAEMRSCVVSYRRNGNRYVGVGYGDGWFIEFAQSNQPPYAPNFSKPGTPVKVHNNLWGYSCYIDQNKLIYYGQNFRSRNGLQALDLKQMKAVLPQDVAPNADFNSENLPLIGVNAQADVDDGNYAIAGDRFGNILNGNDYYTMSHEAVSKTVWATQGSLLHIYPHSCFVKDTDCKGYVSFSMNGVSGDPANGIGQIPGIGAPLGPLSALGDGGMVGLMRSAGIADVFILRLKDPSDLSKGVTAKKIAELNYDDPYMYTDFTGATLYLDDALNAYDFRKSSTWTMNQKVKQLSLIWMSNRPFDVNWDNIEAEVRCYLNEEDKGEFAPIKIQSKVSQQQFITVDSCKNKNITQAELKLKQLNSGRDLLNISEIRLTAYQ